MILEPVKTLLIAFLIFVPLEHLFSVHRNQRTFRKQFTNDVVHALLNGFVTKAGLVGVVVVGTAIFGWLVPPALKDWVGGLPLWLQVPAIILSADLTYYFAHRAFHTVPFLWNIHAIHHSIEEMDWMAAHRNHPVDLILGRGTAFVPAVVFGFSDTAIGVFVAIFHWHVLMIHSNLKLSFGPLRWLIASPQFHHWHHADERVAYDKNFAGQLPFLDALFGTLYMPGKRMPVKYGIRDAVPGNYIQQMSYPFLPKAKETGDDASIADA
ncbi:fatty acid hydroxylase [Mesorhizobium sp. L-8-10]|nr:fatty acid hydroxylase [Mesorhizobium sp. L-8-10]